MKELKLKFSDINMFLCSKCEKTLFFAGEDYNTKVEFKDIYLSNLELKDFKEIINVSGKTIYINPFEFRIFQKEKFEEDVKRNSVCRDFLRYGFSSCSCYTKTIKFYDILGEELCNFIHNNKKFPDKNDLKQILLRAIEKHYKMYVEESIEKNEEKIMNFIKKELTKHKI